MQLLLTFFDSVIGPSVYLTSPKNLDKGVEDAISKLMDNYSEECFFEHSLPNMGFQSYNYLFEIPSDWARGGAETVMISAIYKESIKPVILKSAIENFASELKQTKTAYKAFYIDTSKHKDPEIKTQYSFLLKKMTALQKDLSGKLQNSKVGQFLTLGVSKVGKTSILHQLKNKKFLQNAQMTLYTEIMELVIDSYNFNAYDVGGQEKLRVDWWKLARQPDALIYVVDAAGDKKCWKDSQKEFEKILKERFSKGSKLKLPENTPLLLCVNKIDLNPNYNIKKIKNDLKLEKSKLNYRIQPTSSLSGEGIEDGFRWLVSQLIVQK